MQSPDKHIHSEQQVPEPLMGLGKKCNVLGVTLPVSEKIKNNTDLHDRAGKEQVLTASRRSALCIMQVQAEVWRGPTTAGSALCLDCLEE